MKTELALSDGQLGWALLGVAAGSVPALLGTGRLLRTVSARSVCIATSLAFSLALPLVALASSGWELCAALATLGVASGSLDVAMNTVAIEFQDRTGTRILSRLHGGYSLGVLVGAGCGAFAATFDVSVLVHFSAVAVVLAMLAAAASLFLPPGCAVDPVVRERISENSNSTSGRVGHTFAIPLAVAVMAIAALLVEGMVTDWSALLVSRDFTGGSTVGATAVVVFSSAMFLSRSVGDVIVEWLGVAATLRCAAGVVATATVAGVMVQQQPWGMVVALGFVGFALGPVFPVLISEAGRRSRSGVAVATARVSAVGYGAYLGGPPMVGLLAEHAGLASTFVLVSSICAFVLAVSVE